VKLEIDSLVSSFLLYIPDAHYYMFVLQWHMYKGLTVIWLILVKNGGGGSLLVSGHLQSMPFDFNVFAVPVNIAENHFPKSIQDYQYISQNIHIWLKMRPLPEDFVLVTWNRKLLCGNTYDVKSICPVKEVLYIYND
jgi:hypothetical protein